MSLKEIIADLTPRLLNEKIYYEKEEVEEALQKAYSKGRKKVWKAIIIKLFKSKPDQ